AHPIGYGEHRRRDDDAVLVVLPAVPDIASSRPAQDHHPAARYGDPVAGSILADVAHPLASPRAADSAVRRSGDSSSSTLPSPRSMRVPGVTTADSPRSRVRGFDPGTITVDPFVERMSVATTASPDWRSSRWVADTCLSADGTATSRTR